MPAKAKNSVHMDYSTESAVAHLRAVDPRISDLIDTVGPCTISPDPLQNVFTALARSIVFQQLSGAAATTIFGRLLALVGDTRDRDAIQLTEAFPNLTPDSLHQLSDEQIRTCGISRAKLAALRDLSDRDSAGLIPSAADLRIMDDVEIVKTLTAVRGIGPWTVDMLLIFRLGRPDILPVLDLGVKKGVARTFGLNGLPTPAALTVLAEPWRPFRSVGSWYMWRATELPG